MINSRNTFEQNQMELIKNNIQLFYINSQTMRKYIFSLAVLIFTFGNFKSQAQTQKSEGSDFFNTVVNNHDQLYQLSCIPSAVEMILKYYKVVDFDFYDLQEKWKNKSDGSFHDFDNKKLFGITFSQKFVLPRDKSFPIDSLFKTIEKELSVNKKVIISLPSESGWHMFVICDQTSDGEFISYSKLGTHTLILRNTKEIVKSSNGTEILTYRIDPQL